MEVGWRGRPAASRKPEGRGKKKKKEESSGFLSTRTLGEERRAGCNNQPSTCSARWRRREWQEGGEKRSLTGSPTTWQPTHQASTPNTKPKTDHEDDTGRLTWRFFYVMTHDRNGP